MTNKEDKIKQVYTSLIAFPVFAFSWRLHHEKAETGNAWFTRLHR